jgi:ubiquinone/menaquinone biosynthesis C-methylase UbiE
MFVTGKYNTDAVALEQRIDSHDKFGSNDLNKWIFENLQLSKGLSILDLGCGTGKQSIPIAKTIGDKGIVHSIDLSKDALEILIKKAKLHQISNRIKALSCSHDDIGEALKDNQFDRVVSSYSIYYASNAENVISSIWNKLKVGGILFYCGPSSRNNLELKKFHYSILGKSEIPILGASTFMEGVGKDKTIEIFEEVDTTIFENVLRFDSAQELYNYWSSYNLYDKSIDSQFRIAADEYFKSNDIFETVKRVVGIRACKLTAV